MNRWLTLKEAALELRVTTAQISRMMAAGQLQYMKIGGNEAIRILDPAPALKQSVHEPRLERFPLITAQELAKVLGISHEVIKWHCFKGNLRSTTGGKGKLALYSPKEVRRFIAVREGRRRQSKFSYSDVVVKWLTGFIADCTRPNAEIVSELIRDTVALLPEPQRSQEVAKLWAAVELVNRIIKDARMRQPLQP